ncbi:MAG: hypothetical protein NZ960_03080 [Candidatus Kapabacteria bacterium]|nr:hypothetical protein [Candidatus Kapabacteria bacterium]MDW8012356.1 hypothetical protein [Bacteroidota bacterium]
METWLSVLIATAAIVLLTIGFVLVRLLLQLQRIFRTVEISLHDLLRLLGELRRSLIPGVEAITTAAQRFDRILNQVEPSLGALQRFLAILQGIAEDVRSLEQRVYRRVAPPLEDAAALISGILKAAAVFVRVLTRRHRAITA